MVCSRVDGRGCSGVAEAALSTSGSYGLAVDGGSDSVAAAYRDNFVLVAQAEVPPSSVPADTAAAPTDTPPAADAAAPAAAAAPAVTAPAASTAPPTVSDIVSDLIYVVQGSDYSQEKRNEIMLMLAGLHNDVDATSPIDDQGLSIAANFARRTDTAAARTAFRQRAHNLSTENTNELELDVINLLGLLNDEQKKEVIIRVFDWASTTTDPAIFRAGLAAVTSLNDGGNETMKYLSAFADHAVEGDAIGQNEEIQREYLSVVSAYAPNHPTTMWSVIDKIRESWFVTVTTPDHPDVAILWRAMMAISEESAEDGEDEDGWCVLPDTTFGIPLTEAVWTSFINAYGGSTPDERVKIAASVVRMLTGENVDNVSPLHSQLLDHLIRNGEHNVRRAILNAIADIPASALPPAVPGEEERYLKSKERAVIRAYLTFMYGIGTCDPESDSLRTDAIKQGVATHNFQHRVVKYTIDEDKELRDRAHRFLVDSEPIGGERTQGPPIVVYGIDIMDEFKTVMSRVPEDSPDFTTIMQQCEGTLETLKDERDNHSWLFEFSGGAAAHGIFGLGSSNMAQDPVAFFGGLAVMLPKTDNGLRVYIDAKYQHGSDMQALTAGAGVVINVAKWLELTTTLFAGGMHLDGPSDRPLIQLTQTGTGDDHSARVSRSSTEFWAGLLGAEVRLDAELFEVGGVKVGVFAALRAMSGAGQMYDINCGDDAVDPNDSNYTVNPDGTYTAQGTTSHNCRNGDGVVFVGGSAALGLRFIIPGWLDVD